jgi:ribosomal protein S18 acetylase RimI-like enzyme
MKGHQRSFQHETDKDRMLALARKFSGECVHVLDLPYRFSSWAFDDPENVNLWFDEQGELAAWAVLQSPFWTIDYVFDPASGLHAELLDWSNRRARAQTGTPYSLPAWSVLVFADQGGRISDLEKAGFTCQSGFEQDPWSQVLMHRPGGEPVRAYPPPQGFILRPLAGEDEVPAYVHLHREVFQTRNMTTAWRQRTLKHPAYRSSLDLVVEASGGRLAAFCIAWFDEASREGQIEPLGCHPEFRSKALGRVALAEGLLRLRSLGAETIYVETDDYRNTAFRLYESVGFQVMKVILVYRKTYPD